MHISRTRFKGEIISEFIPAAKKSNKVIILCGGMPSYPGNKNKELLMKLSERGYSVFVPRYRGSWESEGEFMKLSPHQDILDIIDELSTKGFADLFSGKQHRISKPQVSVIGSSFGGPAALLTSKDKRVKKIVALSPVIDWQDMDNTVEPIDFMKSFVKSAFGAAYRIKPQSWDKLKKGKFYNPANEVGNIDGKKIFILHAKDDPIVRYQPSAEFAVRTRAKLKLLDKGEHLSLSLLNTPSFYKKIIAFIEG